MTRFEWHRVSWIAYLAIAALVLEIDGLQLKPSARIVQSPEQINVDIEQNKTSWFTKHRDVLTFSAFFTVAMIWVEENDYRTCQLC